MSDNFTKGQNKEVLFQRERSLGSDLLNKNHYGLWIGLVERLGMRHGQHVETYRRFMQTGGAKPQEGRFSRDRSRGRVQDRSS